MIATTSSPPEPFPVHARAVVRAVRGTFSDLLASVGADPQDPQSISRQLGLNKNLAWKVSKIVQADDPSIALEQMPGAAGIKIFLSGMERAGASPALIQSAKDAVREYEQLIRIHSGDRATLEMMGSELSPAGRRQRDEHHRKLLFQGASYVWGAQARVNVKVCVVGPGSAPGLLDFANVNALVDFRRIRPDVNWVMASRHMTNDDGTPMREVRTEPIDLRFGGEDQAPLMGDFCSKPLPELRRSVDGISTIFELGPGPAGNIGALTCAIGTIQRNVPYVRTAANRWGEHSARCDIPAELLLLDVLIHDRFTFARPPEPVLYGELIASHPGRGRNRLPLSEPLQDLGKGALPLATPEVPRYNRMVESIFARMGWDPAAFHGYRMKVAYPACPTALVLRYALPETL